MRPMQMTCTETTSLGSYAVFFWSAVEGSILKVELTNIKFNHDTTSSASDAINIRQDYTTPIDISNGEWGKGGANHPAAYTADNSVTIKARFTVQPDSITSADIWAVSTDSNGSLGDIVKTTVAFSGGVSVGDANGYIELPISGNTPNAVQKTTTDTWQWKAENINGASVVYDFGVSGPHTVYTILNEPLSPWVNTFGNQRNAWVSALEFSVVSCNATGSTDGDMALAALTTAQTIPYHGGVYYTDSSGAHFQLTEYMQLTSAGNCLDSAQGLSLTARVLGINANAISRTYFFKYNHHCYVAYGLNAYDSCMQIQEPIPDFHDRGKFISSTFRLYWNVYSGWILHGYDMVSGSQVIVPVQNRYWNPSTFE